MNIRVHYSGVLCVLSLLLACRSIGPNVPSGDRLLATDPLTTDQGETIRLALSQLGDDLPVVSYDDVAKKTGTESSEVLIDLDYSRSLRESLIGSVAYLRALTQSSEAVVRRDLYKISSTVSPFMIQVSSKAIQFPFTIEAGGNIEIGRVFPSTAAAKSAKPFVFTDLPYTIENIKKLSPGTYINLPIRGSLALDTSGNMMAELFRYSKDLGKFLTSSSVGTYSHVSQGRLLARGVFSLQLLRLDGDKVRVRVVHADDLLAQGSRSVRLDTRTNLVFVPFSPLQRIRDIKAQVDKGIKDNPIRSPINAAKERIEQFKQITQENIRQLIEGVPDEARNPDIDQIISATRDKLDLAAEKAQTIENKLQDLDQMIFAKADAAYAKLDAAYKQRAEPVLDKIQTFTDRDLVLDNAITLNGELIRKIRTVGDYVFDLRDQVAVEAFERAFFNKALWIGADTRSIRDFVKGPMFDLATAEAIAIADQGSKSPRVQRLLRASREVRESHFGMTFQALFLKTGFGEKLRENDVMTIDQNGRREDLYSRVWEFNQNFKLANFIDAKEIYTSGFITPKGSADIKNSTYWFAWQGSFGDSYKSPIQRAVEAAHTFLGPVAASHGVAKIYTGEFPGQVTARIQANFHGELLTAFFDEKKVNDTLLWRAFANLANHTNAQDLGIPFSENNIDPVGLDKIEGAEAACEQVAMQWGRLYCTIFQDDFLAKLREARSSKDPVARMSFFENYYKIGFLLNRLGTKLMVRYFAEVAHLLNMDQKIELLIDIENNQNPSLEASPKFKSGESRIKSFLEALDVIDGVQRRS